MQPEALSEPRENALRVTTSRVESPLCSRLSLRRQRSNEAGRSAMGLE